ncbi:hypothetical protein DL96DRAFT_209428 [Flagelloscypha sp. PMI_526]|nr:hypothetical protein DL96DRAFT_209428 [Flagelloscypha sp. PMI_526]
MNPPTYPEPPCYSLRPPRGEERLFVNTRTAAPNGTFLKQSTTFTLVLYGQEDGASCPSYGRSASIAGVLNIRQTDNISSVTLKFSGVLEVIGSETRRIHETILHKEQVLWSSEESDNTLGSNQHSLPFSLTLPADYTSGTTEPYQLPPSLTFHDVTVTACVHYSIEATVIRQRKLHGILGPSEESLFVEMKYRPRSRPARPLTNATFLSLMKQAPEAWSQTQETLVNVNDSDPDIICDFFVPAYQIFELAYPIPFHIQLTSTRQGLASFLSSSHHSLPRQFHLGSRPYLKVELLRQIVATDSDGRRSWTNVCIGEGKILQLPPSEADQSEQQNHQSDVHLHWQGTVLCRPDVRVPSFSVRSLVFKDFLILYIIPGKKGHRFRPFRLPVSIAFVSDSWIGFESQALGISS